MLALASLIALAFSAQGPDVPPAAARSPLDRSVEIVLARDAAGESASASQAVPDDFTGAYHTWFRAAEPAGLVLEVVEPSGVVQRACAWAERGPLPFANLAVQPGVHWTVRVRGPAEAAGRAVELKLFARIEDEEAAEELSALDLARCELAVLSACDTNVGERRAGQGVASLQKALHMAGARSVITSLWKVPDEATRELMLDFYRRLWVERKAKSAALWEARMRLRDARDETGARIHATRDWAAWVLTGAPD